MLEQLLNKWVGGACLVALAAGAFFAWVYWPKVNSFCDSTGNVFSVFGFGLGFLGFLITIATLLDIRQISERARVETRKDVRGAIQRVALVLLSAETGFLLHLVSAIRTASRTGQWQEAFVLSREAGMAARLSLGNPLLLDAERQVMRDAGLDLNMILRYIESKRLVAVQPDQAEGLPAQHIKKLDKMVPDLCDISARLRQQALEVPDA
jgi:hypothetical protein